MLQSILAVSLGNYPDSQSVYSFLFLEGSSEGSSHLASGQVGYEPSILQINSRRTQHQIQVTLTPVPTPPGHSTSVKSPTCTFVTTPLRYFPDPRSAPEATSSTGINISVESVSLIRVSMISPLLLQSLGPQRPARRLSAEEQRNVRAPPLAEGPRVSSLDTRTKQTITPSLSKGWHQYWGRWNYHTLWRLLVSLQHMCSKRQPHQSPPSA